MDGTSTLPGQTPSAQKKKLVGDETEYILSLGMTSLAQKFD